MYKNIKIRISEWNDENELHPGRNRPQNQKICVCVRKRPLNKKETVNRSDIMFYYTCSIITCSKGKRTFYHVTGMCVLFISHKPKSI